MNLVKDWRGFGAYFIELGGGQKISDAWLVFAAWLNDLGV